MWGFPKATLEHLRSRYATGTRVKLIEMNDTQAPPLGTRGTVIAVDDIGTIHVHWDNSSLLGLVYGEDRCRVIST